MEITPPFPFCGRRLGEDERRALLALPVENFTEDGSRSPHWLKWSGQPHALDKLVPMGQLMDGMSIDIKQKTTYRVHIDTGRLGESPAWRNPLGWIWIETSLQASNLK